MIPITPLANRTVLLSVASIERIEEGQETIIVLAGGRRMVVVDVAGDLVRRIMKIRAKTVDARQVKRTPTQESEVARFAASQPSIRVRESGLAIEPDKSVSDPVAAEQQAPLVSTVNELHLGLMAFDRTLAAIARYGAADSQQTDDANEIAQQQLRVARDTISDLMRLIDLELGGGDAALSVSEILGFCVAELTNLEQKPSKKAERLVVSTLAKLRRAWATIAADTSRPTRA